MEEVNGNYNLESDDTMADKTSKGKVVTQADIEALANEAKAGYDTSKLKKRVG